MPDWAKHGGTSGKPAPASNTSAAPRAALGPKRRATFKAIENAVGKVVVDEDGEFMD